MTRDEADGALRQAIIDHAEAYGIGFPGAMLSAYGVVAHWQSIEDDDRSRYTTHFDRPTVPTHQALGLFHAGIHCVPAAGDDEE